jgi:hypothetical protein
MDARRRSVGVLLLVTSGCAELVTAVPPPLGSDAGTSVSVDTSVSADVAPTETPPSAGLDAGFGPLDTGGTIAPPEELVRDAGFAGADVVRCPQPLDIDLCASDEECGAAGGGCFCGPQPMVGVRRDRLIPLAQCRELDRLACATGCALTDEFLSQDGRVGSSVPQVRCVPVGGARRCRTFLP